MGAKSFRRLSKYLSAREYLFLKADFSDLVGTVQRFGTKTIRDIGCQLTLLSLKYSYHTVRCNRILWKTKCVSVIMICTGVALQILAIPIFCNTTVLSLTVFINGRWLLMIFTVTGILLNSVKLHSVFWNGTVYGYCTNNGIWQLFINKLKIYL